MSSSGEGDLPPVVEHPIVVFRRRLEMSRRELAELLGLGQSYIRLVELDRIGYPFQFWWQVMHSDLNSRLLTETYVRWLQYRGKEVPEELERKFVAMGGRL